MDDKAKRLEIQRDCVRRIRGSLEEEIQRLAAQLYAKDQVIATARHLRSRVQTQAKIISKLHDRVQLWGICVFFKLPRTVLQHLCAFLPHESITRFSMLSVAHRHRVQGILQWKPQRLSSPEASQAGAEQGPFARGISNRSFNGCIAPSVPHSKLAVYQAAPPKLQSAMDAVAAAAATAADSPHQTQRRASNMSSHLGSFSDAESQRGSTADSMHSPSGPQASSPPRNESAPQSTETAPRRFSFFRRQMVSPGSGPARAGGGSPTRTPPITPEQAGMLLSYTRQLDERLHTMRNNASDMKASIATAETVKEFLADRVSQLEQACQELNAKADSAAHKSVADQQVISFLDEKTRDFERERDAARKEVEEMKASLARPGGALREQAIAGSMAAADAGGEPSSEVIAQWAKERKLLVAEVRRLRMIVTTR